MAAAPASLLQHAPGQWSLWAEGRSRSAALVTVLAFGCQFSVALCVRPFWADDVGLPTRQTGGCDEGGEDHPARQRMIEDMHIRELCETIQQGHIRCVKHFASFLGLSPGTATPEDLRAYQLQMTKDLMSATTFNVRIISLRFFFSASPADAKR